MFTACGYFLGRICYFSDITRNIGGHIRALSNIFIHLLNTLCSLEDITGNLVGGNALLLKGFGDGRHDFVDLVDDLGDVINFGNRTVC